MPYQHPMAMLHYACESSEPSADFLQAAHTRTPSSPDQPWSMILYTDEVGPGNQLSKDNLRKLWVIYMSLLELGLDMLCHEEAWFVPVVVRSFVVNLCNAGISSVFKAALLPIFDTDITFKELAFRWWYAVSSSCYSSNAVCSSRTVPHCRASGAQKRVARRCVSGTKTCLTTREALQSFPPMVTW